MTPMDRLRDFVDPDDLVDDEDSCLDAMMHRIIVLSDLVWERRMEERVIMRWLDNFTGLSGLPVTTERLHALYLLSQFLFFGVREIRVLLKSVYRDLFLVPEIQGIRRNLSGERDPSIIQNHLDIVISETRFLGVGNPSESGVHLLYYFRQENRLSKESFLDLGEIFDWQTGTRRLANTDISHYVFLDDVCGSGDTAYRYSRNFLKEIRAQAPSVKLSYLAMFATSDGIDFVKNNTVFGENAQALITLDQSYKSLEPTSRYLQIRPTLVNEAHLRRVALTYGELVAPGNGGGFGDGQLLLGFSHNIPDNTLPIIWRDIANGSPIAWTAALARYMKV